MKKNAFSLVELVIVIVIIGIIAAIAVPRFSSATDSANRGNVKASLEVMRNALDLYKAEINFWPSNPTALTTTTTTTTPNGTVYGPYIRVFPTNPTLNTTGVKIITSTATPATSDCTTTQGWIYNSSNGEVWGCDGSTTIISPD
ncbi:MAG: hypothetical protein HJJLKODD_00578 [Phycisphaerae bacterium]|nr:hypothetical protein [Phycisphaerae bacterium]